MEVYKLSVRFGIGPNESGRRKQLCPGLFQNLGTC